MRYRTTYWGVGIDLQQEPPAGWCPVCGREIYADGENLCRRCKEMEEQDAK